VTSPLPRTTARNRDGVTYSTMIVPGNFSPAADPASLVSPAAAHRETPRGSMKTEAHHRLGHYFLRDVLILLHS